MGELGPGIPIPSKPTVNRFLDMNGYVIRAMKSETLICPVNVQKRFNWAQEYSKMDPNFWNCVIWSDETSIQAIPQNSEVHIRVHKSIDSKEIPKKPRAQGGGFTVMFWGMFSIYGKGPLVALHGSVNSETYIEMLRDELLPDMEVIWEWYGVNMVFMQDNASPHTAEKTRAFLAETGITVLPWPPQSPDVNPIENIWAWIKQECAWRYPMFPRNCDELIDQVFEIWNSLPDEWFKPYARSVVHWVNAVLKAKGSNTKY